MNIIPERLKKFLLDIQDEKIKKEDCVSIPQDAAQVLNYGGYPQNEIALINKLQNQQQVEQAMARIKTNMLKPSVSAEDATFEALAEVKSRYLQEPSEVQDYIMRRLDEVGAFVPKEQSQVDNVEVLTSVESNTTVDSKPLVESKSE